MNVRASATARTWLPHPLTTAPDTRNRVQAGWVRDGVAVHEEQVGLLARCDCAGAGVDAEQRGGPSGRGVQCLQRRKATLSHKQ